jgi:hypothetical protein
MKVEKRAVIDLASVLYSERRMFSHPFTARPDSGFHGRPQVSQMLSSPGFTEANARCFIGRVYSMPVRA